MKLVLPGWTESVEKRLENMSYAFKIVTVDDYGTVMYNTCCYFPTCHKTLNAIHFEKTSSISICT